MSTCTHINTNTFPLEKPFPTAVIKFDLRASAAREGDGSLDVPFLKRELIQRGKKDNKIKW